MMKPETLAPRTPASTRVVATMTYDSVAAVVGAGTRGSALDTPARQLLFTTDDAEFALRIAKDPQTLHAVTVSGQALPFGTGSADFLVELSIEGIPVARTKTRSDGTFRIEGLDGGDYEMVFAAAGRDFVLGPFLVDTAVLW